jgi:ATP-binding protein involved in chromosome partitioning
MKGLFMECQGASQVDEQERKVQERMASVKQVIVVMSGKGGVGKTSVAVNLAYAWAAFGKRVGLLDTDIHGPNVAKMLGIENEVIQQFGADMLPVTAGHGLKVVSLALLGRGADTPFIWRGPMKAAVIRQFLGDVDWGILDYLVIDSPPGTGDEPLSVCQLLPKITKAVIVTTPQDVAVLDARKSVMFSRELNIPVVGIIENMSGFICPHCHTQTDLFKQGGGKRAAKEMGVEFLGSIPLDPELVALGDSGKPFMSLEKLSACGVSFREIIQKIEGRLV